MLRTRLVAATVMTALFAGGMWADLVYFRDSIMLHAMFLVAAYLSFREFWPLCRATGHQTFSNWGTLSGCALVAVHYWSMHLCSSPGATTVAWQRATNMSLAALAAAILGAFLLTARRHQLQASLGGVAVTCLGLLYIYFLPSFLLKLRHVGPNGLIGGSGWNSFGHHMVVATVVLAKGCDVWAYLIGRLLGRHKAFPTLSPGKTVEGIVAGVVGSVAVAAVLSLQSVGVLSRFGLGKACVIGLCLAIAGIMGDLAESLLKRSAGAKDAGNVVPGYGGAMDVVDSLMVAGPVAYFLIPAML
ncbi:MAG: phosphatidate cytidylyltransferase [Planctomycetota bacterium]|nr:phosphatidate cytidylyltransferase [Planctomycetota bacterium]